MSAPGSAPPDAYTPGTALTVGSHRVVIKQYLAAGGFAHVYVVECSPPARGTSVACLKRVVVPDKPSLNLLRKEVESMKLLKGSKYVVEYIDSHAARMPNNVTYEVFVLMEYCSGSSLINFMNTRLQYKLSEPEVLQIMWDISQAVAAMHYKTPPLIHRDLKIENVLIAGDGTYKLCDFGSTAYPFPVPRNAQEFGYLQDDLMRYTTKQYRSPEMIDLYLGLPIDEKSDIWALGVFLYKICYFTTPFESQGEAAVLHGAVPFPERPKFSSDVRNLICWLLAKDPRQRPNIYDVVAELARMRGTPVPIENIYVAPGSTRRLSSVAPPVAVSAPPVTRQAVSAPQSGVGSPKFRPEDSASVLSLNLESVTLQPSKPQTADTGAPLRPTKSQPKPSKHVAEPPAEPPVKPSKPSKPSKPAKPQAAPAPRRPRETSDLDLPMRPTRTKTGPTSAPTRRPASMYVTQPTTVLEEYNPRAIQRLVTGLSATESFVDLGPESQSIGSNLEFLRSLDNTSGAALDKSATGFSGLSTSTSRHDYVASWISGNSVANNSHNSHNSHNTAAPVAQTTGSSTHSIRSGISSLKHSFTGAFKRAASPVRHFSNEEKLPGATLRGENKSSDSVAEKTHRRSNSIQRRVQMLFSRTEAPPATRTASGYGKYTDGSRSAEMGPPVTSGVSRKPLVPSRERPQTPREPEVPSRADTTSPETAEASDTDSSSFSVFGTPQKSSRSFAAAENSLGSPLKPKKGKKPPPLPSKPKHLQSPRRPPPPVRRRTGDSSSSGTGVSAGDEGSDFDVDLDVEEMERDFEERFPSIKA